MPGKPYMVNGRVNDVANHMVNLNMTIDKHGHGAKGQPWLREKPGLPNDIVFCLTLPKCESYVIADIQAM
jgi:hypothetical protein